METELQRIPFAGQEIQAEQKEGRVLVALKPLCMNLGLNYSAQYRRLQRQPWATVAIMATVGADSKERQMTMIDRRTFAMWLATIDTARMKNPGAAKLVIKYQCEAADVLDAWFGEPDAASRAEWLEQRKQDRADWIEKHERNMRCARLLESLQGMADPRWIGMWANGLVMDEMDQGTRLDLLRPYVYPEPRPTPADDYDPWQQPTRQSIQK